MQCNTISSGCDVIRPTSYRQGVTEAQLFPSPNTQYRHRQLPSSWDEDLNAGDLALAKLAKGPHMDLVLL
jgi:hypothetical protein